MARAKRKVTKVAKTEKTPEPQPESRFPNFLLGLTFVIVVLLLISLFFRSSGARFTVNDILKLFTRSNSPTAAPTPPQPEVPKKATAGSDYTVKAGDTIWSIAEEAYGSGYNGTDIIASNKLSNPGQIEVGQHLNLPQVEAKSPTRGEIAGPAQSTVTPDPSGTQGSPNAQAQNIQQKEYIVQRGDNLWNIAQKTYGDGFMWTRIAEANKLANPRIIHAGNRLRLP